MTLEVFLAIIAFLIIGVLILRGVTFNRKFSKVEIGMTYDQVTSLIDSPRNTDVSADTMTCVWRLDVLRGWRITRVVVFKNGRVISIVHDK